jgi:hypothetical protein
VGFLFDIDVLLSADVGLKTTERITYATLSVITHESIVFMSVCLISTMPLSHGGVEVK